MRTRPVRPIPLLALMATIAASCTNGPSAPISPPGSSPSPSPSPSVSPGIGVPVSGEGWELTVTAVHQEFELAASGENAEPHHPESGLVFVVVDADFRALDRGPGQESTVSTVDVALVGEDGVSHPAEGGGEDSFCVDCSLDVTTSDEVIRLSFVFILPTEEAGPTSPFRFRFREALEVPVSIDQTASPPPPTISSPDDRSANLELIGSAPQGSSGLGPDYANSDLAFWGDLAFAGSYDGFRVIDVSDPTRPEVLANVPCRGRQGDISVWEHLVFLSVDAPVTGEACASGQAESAGPGTFEGIRVFDVTDPRSPEFVTAVATDCGSHTHTLVPDPDHGRMLLYVSSYPGTSASLGPNCQNPFGRISVVEVPLDAPATAAVVARPGLPDLPIHRWPELPAGGGPAGFIDTAGCHDITVFMELDLAAAACMSEGQLWDISDPVHPKVTAHIDVPEVEFWHSAAFTHDGQIVVFGDETFFGRRGCQDPDLGALWFFRVADPSRPLAHLPVARPQGDEWPCSYHNFNVLPVPGRYLLVASAYTAGTSVVDFTDPTQPEEIGFYRALASQPANSWSSYWYEGFIFATDLNERGLDVFAFTDPDVATPVPLGHLNPQTQEAVLFAPLG